MNETDFSSFVRSDQPLLFGGWCRVPGAYRLDVVIMEYFVTIINRDRLSEI
jgi:hypothetical protein